jgi:hypothetical protein
MQRLTAQAVKPITMTHSILGRPFVSRRRLCVGGGRRLKRRPSLACAAFVVAPLLFGARIAAATPYVPTDDAQILERLPTANSNNVRELRRLHAELAASPQDLGLALRVAARDIETARADGDPRYNGYAEAALSPWIRLANPPEPVLVLRATLRQSSHDFAAALADLDRVISADPGNAQARLTRAIVLLVEGDYPKALGNCLSLRRLAQPLVTEICVASVQSVSGQAEAADRDLGAMLDETPAGDNGSLRLWALTVLAETAARRGDDGAADRHFRDALSMGLRDGYLLGAYADFLLDRRRPADVELLLRDDVRIDPLLLPLALAEKQMKAPNLAPHVADLTERFAAARERGDVSHRREEARFTLELLNRPDLALPLAKANWEVQREPSDLRLLLAAALAAHRPADARPALDFLATSHLEDGYIRALAQALDGKESSR